MLSEDGSCNAKGLDPTPYNLAKTLAAHGISEAAEDFTSGNYDALVAHAETERIWRLKQLCESASAESKSDWFGVYRATTNGNGEQILLKEAYIGKASRAEFPLSEDWAAKSNNTTVRIGTRFHIIFVRECLKL